MLDSNVLQILPFPLPNCGTPHLALFPPGLVSIRRFPQDMACTRARSSLWMVRFSRYVQNWSSMTDKTADKLLKIGAPLWWALIIRQNVQTLSDTTMGSPRPRTLAILLMWSRFLSLSHWCSPTVALWIIIKYFSNLICINFVIYAKKFLLLLEYTL